MTARLASVVGVALVCWSCNTETIQKNICGNGIIDPGEDCDVPGSNACPSCSIACAMPGDTEECEAYDSEGGTAGFICGPDNLCHAPSGKFEPSRSHAVPSTAFQITDVDGDGRSDLLVPSQNQITTIRFASGENPEMLAIPTPIARGNPTFGPLDERGGNDTLLPTSDGIVAYTATAEGQPTPFPFPSFVPSEEGTPKFVQPITAQHLSIIGIDADQTLSYTAFDIGQLQPTDLGEATMCDGTTSDLGFARFEDAIDVFDVESQHQVIAMWLRPLAPAPGPARLCVIASDFDGTGYAISQITPTIPEPTSRPILANLRGDPCPSLIVAHGPQLVEYKPVSANRPCSFSTTPTFLVGAPAGAAPVGTVALVPAIAGAAANALALSTGVYRLTGNVLAELYGSDRAIRRIRTLDMNGDGDLDAVATTFTSFGFGSDDIDILDRRPAGFLRFRFDTETEVQTFQLGDFDGNEVQDVAYVDFGAAGDRLQIAYGTTDQLLSGVTVGEFAQLLSMIPTQVIDSSDRIGAVSDLAVLFIESGSELPTDMGPPSRASAPALSLLHGSPQRTMLAFFDPRPQFPPPTSESQFRGVITGRFSDGSSGNDVLAIEQEGPLATIYLSRGASGGELGSDISSDASNIKSCANNPPGSPPSPEFCIDDAQYLAWRTEGASHDTVLAIDTEYKVIGFDPTTMMQGTPIAPVQWSDTFIPAKDAVVRELQQLDLAGEQKLMIGLGTPTDQFQQPTGGLFLCDFDPTAGPTSCLDVSAKLAELRPTTDGSTYVCLDAGIAGMARAARFEPPTGDPRELVVLCLTRFELDGMMVLGSNTLFRLPLDLSRADVLIDGAFGDALQIGDVSGDGIDDIVMQLAAFQSLGIYRQCTSRDLECKTLETGGEAPPSPGGN